MTKQETSGFDLVGWLRSLPEVDQERLNQAEQHVAEMRSPDFNLPWPTSND